MFRKLLPFIFVITLSLLTIIPFFQNGFFPIHDDTQVARVYEMSAALKDGNFPVRLVPDLGYGYGYPIFNFYAPLAYYVGGFLVLLGFQALVATKIMMGLGMLLAAITMYFLARSFVSEKGAVIASLLYMFAPYHAVNLYVRGAVSELWAYAFLPLAIYGLITLYKKASWRGIILTAFGLAGVILSHNLTAFMLIPFYGVFLLILSFKAYKEKSKQKIGYLLLGVVLGVMVSAFYWLPALGEMGYTNVSSQITGGSQYKDHFVCLSQLWASQWGFAGSTAGCLDGISFQIGKLHILFALLGLIVGVTFFKKTKALLLLLLGGVLSVFLVLPVSKVIWDSIPQMAFIQFPWRYIQFIVFFFSLAGGFVMSYLLEKYMSKKNIFGWGVVIIIISGMLFLYQKNFKPQLYLTDYRDETSKEVLQWTVSKISDEYLPRDFNKPKIVKDVPQVLIEGKDIEIDIQSQKTQYLRANITTETAQTILINKAYYPGWKFVLNNNSLIPVVKDGLYHIKVPKGDSLLEARFVQTPLEKSGNIISLIGVSIIVVGIIMMRGKSKKHAKTS